MFKHQDVINNLTLEQKLNLIADVNALGGVEGYGFLREANLSNANDWLLYPDFNSLANSWDIDLIKTVCSDLFSKAKSAGINLMNLPSASVKVSPYSSGLSEDAYLSGELVEAIATQGKLSGMATCLCDPQIEKEDVDYLDVKFNERVINECLLPSQTAVLQKGVSAVKLTEKSFSGEYSNVNDKLLANVKAKYKVINDKRLNKEGQKHVDVFGDLYNGCSVTELFEAHERYLNMMKSFEDGQIALADINATCESGWAISNEMIDGALDKILDFVDFCNKPFRANSNANEQTILTAMVESTVMLKNKGVLPLKKRSNVAVVGALANEVAWQGAPSLQKYLSDNAVKDKLNFIGYSEGYGKKGVRTPVLLKDALDLANKADTVIVALGYDKEQSAIARKNRNCKLPANQEELLRRLCSLNKKVVALVYGGCDLDMSFDNGCQAVLLAPDLNTYGVKAIYDILIGKVSPGGKLKNTLYDNTDKYFERLKNYKDTNRNQVGVFYGYRYYDTGGYKVKYPFGHGLSYGKFAYSGLSIKNGVVSFTVKNKGSVTASEAVQVYVGKQQSSIIRAKKELKYFTKVTLKAGKSATVSFRLDDLNIRVYDVQNKKYEIENGAYDLYVASSVSDVKLKTKFVLVGQTLKADGLKYNQFFQNLSNIIDGGYYLEETVAVPKRMLKEGRFQFALTCLIGISFLSLIYLYLVYIGWMPGGVIAYSVIGGLIAIPLISAITVRSRSKKIINKSLEKSKKMKQEKIDKIDPNQIVEPIPYEELFVTEFAVPVIDVKEEQTVEENVEDKEKEYVFDPEFTFEKACAEMIVYYKERGVYVDAESARSLFSALASSRLLILNAEDKGLLTRFVYLLGKYFDYSTIIEDFADIHAGGDDVIYSLASCHPYGVTRFADALIHHRNVENNIRLMALTGAQSEFIKPCFSQVYKYIDQHNALNKLTVRTESGDYNYSIPQNVWFIVVLEEGQKAIDIPKYLLETACEVNLNLKELELPKPIPVPLEEGQDPSEQAFIEPEITPVTTVTYHQFEKMLELALRDNMLDENLWKRIDKLETIVNEMDSSYRMTSKTWQRLEKYTSVYLRAGGEPEETLDSVVANHVINTMVTSVAEGKNKTGERFVNTIENVFGEGHAPNTVKRVKSTGLKI